MVTFGEITFHETEFAYLEKEDNDSSLFDTPYVLRVHLKCGLVYGLKYEDASARNWRASEICRSVDNYFSKGDALIEIQSTKTDVKNELVKMDAQINLISYRLNDFMRKQELDIEDSDGRVFLKDSDSIDDLDLSVRAYNCLRRAGVTLIGDIRQLGIKGVSSIRNMGKKSLKEIVEVVNVKTGLQLF